MSRESEIIKKSYSKKVGEIQVRLLKLLEYFDGICKQNSIEYWLDGGTLLGAVRNQGFIPWDDDLDVGVHQADYEKLVEILNREVKNTKSYVMYNPYRTIAHFTEYLGDTTMLKTSSLLPVQIDIIRIKSVPNNVESLDLDRRKVNVIKYFTKDKNFSKELVANSSEEKYINGGILRQKSKYYKYFINEYLTSLPRKQEDMLYNYCFNSTYVSKEREYYKHDEIFPLGEVEFEGVSFPCPRNVKRYLTILYGEDYMTPPPKDLQVPAYSVSLRNYLPRFIIKVWMAFVYFVKEVKGGFSF